MARLGQSKLLDRESSHRKHRAASAVELILLAGSIFLLDCTHHFSLPGFRFQRDWLVSHPQTLKPPRTKQPSLRWRLKTEAEAIQMRPPSGSLQVITLFSPTSLLRSTLHTQPTSHRLFYSQRTHTHIYLFILFLFNL